MRGERPQMVRGRASTDLSCGSYAMCVFDLGKVARFMRPKEVVYVSAVGQVQRSQRVNSQDPPE